MIFIACAMVRNFVTFSANGYVEWIKWAAVFSLGVIAVIIINSLLFDRKTIQELAGILKNRKI